MLSEQLENATIEREYQKNLQMFCATLKMGYWLAKMLSDPKTL